MKSSRYERYIVARALIYSTLYYYSEVPLEVVLEDFSPQFYHQNLILSQRIPSLVLSVEWRCSFASNTTFANCNLKCRVCVSDYFEICRLLIQN